MKTNNTSIKKNQKKNSPYSAYEAFEKKVKEKDKLVYCDMKTFERKVADEAFLLKLASEWVEFTLNEANEVLTLEEFYIHKSLYEGTIDDWFPMCPELKQAHDYAKMIIFKRSHKGAMKKIYPENYVKHCLPIYSKTWKKLEEWRTEIKNKIEVAQKGNGVFNIVIEDYTK